MGSTLSFEIVGQLETAGQYKGDAGVDLPAPEDTVCKAGSTTKVDLGVSVRLIRQHWLYGRTPLSYLVLPRSSIKNTPLRLANSVGLIDSGYTGNLTAYFDNHSSEDYLITKGQKLLQIVSPSLERPAVVFVKEHEITERGSRGFGSTSK
jgi:dUTP pyrophosphatase